ncbi:MAG: tetratricopeptide repeat protein [Promethearchaeota archaeon]|jgi:tetratricopeptide (TPR) repeat protein
MSTQKPNEIVQAEQLISKGKTEEALKIVNKFQMTFWTFYTRMESEKALEIALQSNELIGKYGKQSDIAGSFFILGYAYLQMGEHNKGLEFGLKSLAIQEELNNLSAIARSLSLVGLSYNYKGQLDRSIEFFTRSLAIKEIDNLTKVTVLQNLGLIYVLKGELNKALEYNEEGAKIAREMNFYIPYAIMIFQLGYVYVLKAKYDKAEEYFKKCLEVCVEINYSFYNGWALYGLINLNIEIGAIEEAQGYLEKMEELANKNKNSKTISSMYLLAKGTVLKESNRSLDRAVAEQSFKKILTDRFSNPVIYQYTLWHFSQFLIEELGKSNDLKILDELNPLILRSLNVAEKTHSYMQICGVKLLQAKLALVQMKFDDSKKLLSQAQQLAEQHNLSFFAQKLSNEHDLLLEQQEIWNLLKETNAPMSERIKLAAFDGIIKRMQGISTLKLPELEEEKPVLLLIIAEGGILTFSYSFKNDKKFNDELFGSFITAFKTFSNEFFSMGLDRAKFGEDMILMETVYPFSICYIFRGQSYPAKQKLSKFTNEIKNDTFIWQSLKHFNNTSQVAELKDLPQIENLIKDIFIA